MLYAYWYWRCVAAWLDWWAAWMGIEQPVEWDAFWGEQ